MTLVSVLVTLGILIGLGIILRAFRRDWLSHYFIALAFTIAFPIVVAIKITYVTIIIIWSFWNLLGVTFKVVAKAVLFVIISAFSSLIIILTFFVPHIGRVSQNLNAWLEQLIDTSDLVSECQYTRTMMVEIVAEQDNRTPEYDSEERYREELVQVKDSGKEVLSAGESVLSLCIGGGLLISQVYGFQLNQPSFYGFTAGVGIQLALFTIAVSILYRVSILDFLAFSGDENLSSVDEFDAALSYQKGISRVGLFQILMFIIVLVMRLTNSNRETVKATLAFSHDDNTTFLEAMTFAWKQLNTEESGN